MLFRPVSFLLGLAALMVASSALSARAETPSTNPMSGGVESSAATVPAVEPAGKPVSTVDRRAINSTSSSGRSELGAKLVQAIDPTVTPVSTVEPLATNPTVTQIAEDRAGQRPVQQANEAAIDKDQADSQRGLPEAMGNEQLASSEAAADASVAKPIPGTLETSADYLTAKPEVSSDNAEPNVAQVDIDPRRIEPGRATRGGSSYIGIGGNIGFTGDTGIGSGAFVVNSKIGLTRNVSFRPAVLIGDNTDFLLPITYDFTIESADPFAPVPFAPFVGGGVVFSTDGDSNVGFLLTGGVDVPLSAQFVANASVNVGFLDDANVGVLVGIGYTFPGFSR
jgi:hypothetical protein